MTNPNDAHEAAGDADPSRNYASLHRDQLAAAVETATAAELFDIDRDLAREGWSISGALRSRISQRLAELTQQTGQEG